MASFVFPSPDDIQEFEAPNGILYTWDTEDGKWVVKSTSSVGSKLDKPYVVYHGPTPPTVSVSPDGQLKDGELWYSTDTLELFVYGSGDWWPTAADVTGELSTLRTSIEQAEEDIDQLEVKVKALEGTVVDDIWEFHDRASTPRDGEFTILNNGVLATRFEDATTIAVSATSKNGNIYDFQNIVVGDVVRLAKSLDSLAEYKITAILPDGFFTVDVIRAVGEPVYEMNYDFVFLSSYDPSGLATIEYVDLQDDLRIKKTGDAMSGDLLFKRGANPTSLIIQPAFEPDSANSFIYVANRGTLRIRSAADAYNINRNTHIIIGKNVDDDTPITNIYHLQDPEEATHAANKRYVDTAALPIGGGTVTGTLTVQGESFFVNNSSGQEVFRIQPTGFCMTQDLFRVTRDINAPAFQARIDDEQNVEIKTDGTANFSGNVTGGRIIADRDDDSGRLIEAKQNGTSNFWVNVTGEIKSEFNVDSTSSDKTITTKKYVDDAIAAGGGGISGGKFTEPIEFETNQNKQVDFIRSGGNADIHFNGSYIVSFQNETIKFSKKLDMNNKQIKNLAKPAVDSDAVTRGYLKGANISATSSSAANSGGFYFNDGRLFYRTPS